MIRTLYRVTVDIPEAVWVKHSESQQFEHQRIEACKGHIESGTDSYDNPFEWAVFDDIELAKACEKKLKTIFDKLSKEIS